MTHGVERRHLNEASLRSYLRSNVPIDQPIPGDPTLILFISPKRSEIGLRVPFDGTGIIPDPGLKHIRCEIVQNSERRYLEIAVTRHDLFADAYPMLCVIADRIQLQGLSPEQALGDTVRSLANLIQSSHSLEIEREVGLFGELIVLLGLTRTIGSKEALGAWLGPRREEHDFALRGLNIEVKTTRSERRIHWIESLTQLRPTGSQPLWLVSCQITSAGPGTGNRLPDLVRLARAEARDDEDRAALEAHLEQAGWRDRFERTCQGPWALRTKPAAFAVADDFPRLTPDQVRRVAAREQIIRVRYQIDLTDHTSSAPLPNFLTDSLAEVEHV